VDRIEKDLLGNAQVVRLSTREGVGAEVADAYSIRAVPSVLVFDGKGKVAFQGVGIPDPDHIERLVRKLARIHDLPC
jgi:hypothetical protein